VFFLRREHRKEAEFVVSLGEAMDAQVFIWEVENGNVRTTGEETEYDVRTFADELSLRLYHWAVHLYWEAVKELHLDLLTRVYGKPEIARAQ
jgi:hypothetical protein